MASSDAEVCNIALSSIGSGKPIQDLDESSEQADACRTFYDDVRDEVLRDYAWPFAKQSMELNLVESDPNDDWGYAYRYPSAALFIRRIWGAVRNPSLAATIKYDIGSDATGKLIYTDEPDAEIEYTARIEAVSKWDSGYVLAVAYLLASKIAMRLVKEDKIGMTERMEAKYVRQMLKVRANAENERRPDPPPESDIITARGGY